MGNLGYNFLKEAHLLDSDDFTKCLALYAYERSMEHPIGMDMYPHVWEGNVTGPERCVRAIRNTLMKSFPSVRAACETVGIDEKMLRGCV